jgi:hypothetical protein
MPAFCPSLLVSYKGPLDELSVLPNGWWDVARRDFGSYRGPLIRIDRSSDGAVLDVYAQADGWLNTADIAAFCAGGFTGRLQKIYDQSGNGRDLTNTGSVGSAPFVYFGGAMYTLNTKPTADYNGSSNNLKRSDACGLTGATAYTHVQVCDADAYSTVNRAGTFGRDPAGSGQAVAVLYDDATTMSLRYGGPIQTFGSGIPSGIAQTPHYVIHGLAAGAGCGSGWLEVNGAAATETAETNPAVTLSLLDQSTVMGSGVGDAFAFNGRITAKGIWASELSAGDMTILRACCDGLIV